MSLVEGSSALQQTVEVAETLKVVSESTQQTAEIYSISQYLTETQADQPQAALGAWKYVESLQTYVPQVVTGLTATAGGAYAAVSGGVAYVLSAPAAFCAIAAALGVGVGVGMYQVNPDFWNEVSEALVNAGCMVGGGVLSIFKDGKNYIPETTIDVVKQLLIDSGAYNDGGTVVTGEVQGYSITQPLYVGNVRITQYGRDIYKYTFLNDAVCVNYLSGNSDSWLAVSRSPFDYIIDKSYDGGETWQTPETHHITDSNSMYGTTFYYIRGSFTGRYQTISPERSVDQTEIMNGLRLSNIDAFIAAILFGTIIEQPTVPGLEKQQGATYPDETKTIPEEYPNWANDGMTFLRPKTREIGENPVLDPDNVEEVRALPVEIPDTVGNPMEVGYTEPQITTQDGDLPDPSADPDPEPDAEPVPSWKRVIKGINNITDPDPDPDPEPYPSPVPTPEPAPEPATPQEPVDPPTDDGGITPAIIPPTDGANTGMNNVYNPTKAEMREFNAFLWSNDFIDTIKKILNDPMQAVIALQIVYVTPPTESGHTIVVGSIDTEVSSNIVTSQYVSVNCGSVSIPEYFKDYTDYSPYTQVSCYLPFIGFVQLDTDDIVGSTVSIEYTVDLFTGTCLAEITVTKGNMSAVLYTFNGNCAVQLPLTSATHSSIVGTLTGVSTALLGVSTGNPLLALGGIASAGMSYAKNDISRSGSLGSNAGAMGIKKPYILVRRPVAYNAERYNEFIGIPSNKTVVLSTLSGYTRIQETHVENIAGATDREKDMILTQLKQGVIL